MRYLLAFTVFFIATPSTATFTVVSGFYTFGPAEEFIEFPLVDISAAMTLGELPSTPDMRLISRRRVSSWIFQLPPGKDTYTGLKLLELAILDILSR
jgi:hypothetical protein